MFFTLPGFTVVNFFRHLTLGGSKNMFFTLPGLTVVNYSFILNPPPKTIYYLLPPPSPPQTRKTIIYDDLNIIIYGGKDIYDIWGEGHFPFD